MKVFYFLKNLLLYLNAHAELEKGTISKSSRVVLSVREGSLRIQYKGMKMWFTEGTNSQQSDDKTYKRCSVNNTNQMVRET